MRLTVLGSGSVGLVIACDLLIVATKAYQVAEVLKHSMLRAVA